MFPLGQGPNCGERRIVVGPFAKLGCAKRRVWAVGVFVADMNIVLPAVIVMKSAAMYLGDKTTLVYKKVTPQRFYLQYPFRMDQRFRRPQPSGGTSVLRPAV